MRKTTFMFVFVILTLSSLVGGCNDKKSDVDKQIDKIGDVDKQLEKYQKALQNQEKPTKPMWDR